DEQIEKKLYLLAIYSKSRISFGSKAVEDYPVGSAKENVAKLVDKFEETPYSFKRIDAGKCSEGQ
ncbi:MAG: hypothetical protein PHV68_04480, partial [Candidatus Gastranaerophilales bacterium]|nr:hypothetical protein [Candidatus Gastranaerophilales bacterium]